jgi:hypothetical protein
MPDSSYAFTFSPTLNVDVGGKTAWTITGGEPGNRTWFWTAENPNIVRLEVAEHDTTQCTIYGVSGGETIIRADASDRSGELSQQISAGLMFVWGPDGRLYAANASSFQLMSSEQEAFLARTIPTQEQMENKAAYYVPPDPAASAINVTCYVVNLEHIKTCDVWRGSSKKKAGE